MNHQNFVCSQCSIWPLRCYFLFLFSDVEDVTFEIIPKPELLMKYIQRTYNKMLIWVNNNQNMRNNTVLGPENCG